MRSRNKAGVTAVYAATAIVAAAGALYLYLASNRTPVSLINFERSGEVAPDPPSAAVTPEERQLLRKAERDQRQRDGQRLEQRSRETTGSVPAR